MRHETLLSSLTRRCVAEIFVIESELEGLRIRNDCWWPRRLAVEVPPS
jgi:hypothetical protein